LVKLGFFYYFLIFCKVQSTCIIFSHSLQTKGKVKEEMALENQHNPDNRKNNVERLHDMIENTQAKMEEAERIMQYSDSEEEKARLLEKNAHRQQSIVAMQQEMEDEAKDRENGYE
jgi:small acid-soluble spore protein (thioredoxin-like protein)